MDYRIEKDSIGELQLPKDALFGINSLRAKQNFPDDTRFSIEWYKAVPLVKLACYKTYQKFVRAADAKFDLEKLPLKLMPEETLDALIMVAEAAGGGDYFDQFIVPAISGGAGTSINMNVNEILANAALLKMGKQPGDYQFADPFEDANIFQSTNDVIPTSLKLVTMQLLDELEDAINRLRLKVETLEKAHRNSLRIAYTQMQEAVPTSYGKLFSTYNEALSRDWWRVSKAFERIKVINLGGSAIGTGITVPRFFIFEVVQTLQELTRKPLTRSENLEDATNNLDPFVEVHAILKSHAVNLEKMSSDLRLLGSDILYQKEIQLPRKQVGSSIMPGKINPVIPEFVISASHKIYANDTIISSLAGQGMLELNAYLPAIGHALIESLKLLTASCNTLTDNLFEGLEINTEVALQKLYHSPSITTALVPFVGYHSAGELAKEMKSNGSTIFAANEKLNLISTEKLEHILQPQNLLKLGYSLNEILPDEDSQ